MAAGRPDHGRHGPQVQPAEPQFRDLAEQLLQTRGFAHGGLDPGLEGVQRVQRGRARPARKRAGDCSLDKRQAGDAGDLRGRQARREGRVRQETGRRCGVAARASVCSALAALIGVGALWLSAAARRWRSHHWCAELDVGRRLEPQDGRVRALHLRTRRSGLLTQHMKAD